MDSEEWLYRALEVPGLLGQEGRRRAAAWRLLELTKIHRDEDSGELEADGNLEQLEKLAGTVLDVIAEALDKDELDPWIGGFSGRAKVTMLTESWQGAAGWKGILRSLDDMLPVLLEAAANAVIEFAKAHREAGWTDLPRSGRADD